MFATFRHLTSNIRYLNAVLLLAGLALFASLLLKVGPMIVYAHLRNLGWRFLLIFPPYAFGYLLHTLGWKVTLKERQLPLSKLFSFRMAGEAINYLTPSASLGGEPVKAYLLKRAGIPLEEGLASVVVAKTAMTTAQLVFTMGGILLALLQTPNPRPQTSVLVSATALALALSFALTFFLAIQRQGLLAFLLKPAKKLSFFQDWLKTREEKLLALDRRIGSFYRQNSLSFALSFALHLAGWIVQGFEVYLLLAFLGLPVSLPTALAIHALSVLAKAAAFFIPGGLGIQEGGNILIFLGFSLSVQMGMTFSLVRRARELLWAAFGLLALARYHLNAFSSPGQAISRVKR
ncbi:MAG: flippase-like domain-containing protein [Candidatus Methylomirabilales bacterium]